MTTENTRPRTHNKIVLTQTEMSEHSKELEMRRALEVAATALELSMDWGVDSVQAEPPIEWGLGGGGGDPADGWVGVSELVEKLRRIAHA